MKTIWIILAVALFLLGLAQVGEADATLEEITSAINSRQAEATPVIKLETRRETINPQETMDGYELQATVHGRYIQ